jgi:hypothetical protein
VIPSTGISVACSGIMIKTSFFSDRHTKSRSPSMMFELMTSTILSFNSLRTMGKKPRL